MKQKIYRLDTNKTKTQIKIQTNKMYRKSVSLKTNIKFQNFNYFRPLAKLKIMKLYNNKILEIELKKKNTYGSRTKAQKLT